MQTGIVTDSSNQTQAMKKFKEYLKCFDSAST